MTALVPSILPSLAAVLLAFGTKIIWFALLVAILVGCIVLTIDNSEPWYEAFHHFFTHISSVFSNRSIIDIVIFIMFIGGLLTILEHVKAFTAFSNYVQRKLQGAKQTRLLTWGLGLLLFLDDYTSILISGSSLRDANNSFGTSPYLIAYIIINNALAASVFFISTWGPYQSGIIEPVVKDLKLSEDNGSSFLIEATPYHVYTLVSFVATLLVAWSGKWLGMNISVPERNLEPKNEVLSEDEHSDYIEKDQVSSDECLTERMTLLSSSEPRYSLSCDVSETAIVDDTVQLYNGDIDSPNASDKEENDAPADAAVDAKDTGASVPGRVTHVDLILALGLVLCFTIVGIIVVGSMITSSEEEALTAINVLSNAPSTLILISATIISITFTVLRLRKRGYSGLVLTAIKGTKNYIPVSLAIMFANGLSRITSDLKTGENLAKIMEGSMPEEWTISVIFLFTFVLCVACGSAWASMAISMPISFPFAENANITNIGLISASVICGAVSGAVLVPYSDKSLLSSSALQVPADQISKALLPQNLMLVVIATLGFLMFGYGAHAGVVYPICIGLVIVLHLLLAREPPKETVKADNTAVKEKVADCEA